MKKKSLVLNPKILVLGLLALFLIGLNKAHSAGQDKPPATSQVCWALGFARTLLKCDEAPALAPQDVCSHIVKKSAAPPLVPVKLKTK